MIALQNTAIIGTIEMRNWLSEKYPDFKKSRRTDIDDALEKMGEDIKNGEGLDITFDDYEGEDEDG